MIGVGDAAFSSDSRWLALTSADGALCIHDALSGERLATLVSLGEGADWLVVTPDGLFDGSPAAWKQINWRFSQDLLDLAPVEAFFSEFYHPGLLADLLSGRRPRAPTDFAKKDRRQPQVDLTLADGQTPVSKSISSRTVTVKVALQEAPPDALRALGSGVRDVRLFRNGSLVKVWRGDVLPENQSKVVLEATVRIVAGENRLTVYAFNRDNIKSSDTTLILQGAESLKRRGTAFILAVGINDYANPSYRSLSYAVADARAFAEELMRQQTKLGTFDRVEVIPLLDREATKANILWALELLAGQGAEGLPPGAPAVLQTIKPAQPEDAVFVFYAGHGTARGSRFYMISHGLGHTGSPTDASAASVKTPPGSSISDVELEQALEKVDAGHLVLVIDSCKSGQALEAEEKRRGPMNSKGLAQLAYEKGIYILAAAQSYQGALEAAQFGHGLLTYGLVEEGLKTRAADLAPTDGQVVAREWLDYAVLRVPQLQTAMMQEARRAGRQVAFVEGEEKILDLEQRGLQRPRVFYRREPEVQPFVIAKPPVTP